MNAAPFHDREVSERHISASSPFKTPGSAHTFHALSTSLSHRTKIWLGTPATKKILHVDKLNENKGTLVLVPKHDQLDQLDQLSDVPSDILDLLQTARSHYYAWVHTP